MRRQATNTGSAAQTAFYFGGEAEPPPPGATIEAGGRPFSYRHDEEQGTEYYMHPDERGWTWEAFRHTHPLASAEIRRTWYARVYGVRPRRRRGRAFTAVSSFTLNLCLSRGETILERGPLYDVDCHDLRSVLDGLSRLAAAGVWPDNSPQASLTLFNNGSPEGYVEPLPLEALYNRLETGTLDPRFEDADGGGFFHRMTTGAFRARGDFVDSRHYFDVRGPLAELLPIARAIKAARLRHAYQDALLRHRRARA